MKYISEQVKTYQQFRCISLLTIWYSYVGVTKTGWHVLSLLIIMVSCLDYLLLLINVIFIYYYGMILF